MHHSRRDAAFVGFGQCGISEEGCGVDPACRARATTHNSTARHDRSVPGACTAKGATLHASGKKELRFRALQSEATQARYTSDVSQALRCRMSTVLAELKQKAAQLEETERAELALALIESLDGKADAGTDEAWRIEVDRRIAEIDRGEVQLIPGDEVFARLRRRLG